QREETFAIGEPHIPRPKPTVAQRLGVGLSAIPVAAHDAVGPGNHLADFTRRQLTPVGIDDQHVDARARHPTRGENLLTARMLALTEQPLGDMADGHGRFALAEDLRELRPKDLERLFRSLTYIGAPPK